MRILVLTLAALAATLTSLGAVDSNRVQAATVTIEGVATGGEEVPAVTGPGTARVRLAFDDVAKTLSFTVTVNGISGDSVTASHIHRGASGVNGPVVHVLSSSSFTIASGTINLSDADIADLRGGNFYVNVHSKENPGGFARLQIRLPTPALAAPTTGDAGLADAKRGEFGLLAELVALGLAVLSFAAIARRHA